MAAGSPHSAGDSVHPFRTWIARHEIALLLTNGIILASLFFLHLFGPATVALDADLVNFAALLLVGFVFVTIAWKGLVPAAICAIGVVLIHSAIIVPYYFPENETFAYLLLNERSGTLNPEDGTGVTLSLNFVLGLGTVAMSMMVAYAPKLLFTRNRPEDSESVWSKYPIWYDNVKLAGRYSESLVPAKSLMEDRDRYLIWRYEYVLASIYGTPHLVRPEGLVPEKSTEFIRDRQSGLLMGKGKYNGYFV